MKFIISILILILPTVLSAQKVKFKVSIDKSECEVGEEIVLTYKSNSDGELELPEIKNCKIVEGPYISQSGMSITINGVQMGQADISQSYVIVFTKKGDQVIPPAKFTVNGKTYHSDALHVKVTASTSNYDESTYQNKDIYTTISLNKSKVYQGESVLASYRLYTRYLQYNHNALDFDFPAQQNVWKHEFEMAKQLKFQEEIINKKKTGVLVFQKHLLIPQKSGKLKLNPFTVKWRVSDGWMNYKDFNLVSNSPEIEVLPLPDNAPASFSGAVGKFSFEVNYSKSELKVNDALDITIKIRGNGNLKFINEFKLELPNEMEKYDPEVGDTISINSNGMEGSRTYKYLVIPRSSGKYKLAPIEFSYFDPETGKYKTISSPAFDLNVLKGDGTEDNTVINQQSRVKVLNQDIRHLREYEEDIRVKGDYLFGSPLFLGGILMGPLSFFLFVFIRRKTKKSDSQLSQQKVKRATKIAIKQMQHAKSLLDQKNIDGFYEESMKTLYEYTGLKLGLPTSSFNKENIRQKLAEKNISTDIISQFVKIIEDCEMARFARHHAGYENQLYNDSIRLIELLEDKL